jgi:hypothetical protein
MVYLIESTTAQRCTSNLNGQWCGLAEHHTGDHVTPDGRKRWTQSIFAPLAEAWGDRIGSPTAGQQVTAGNVSESAAVLLSQRMDRISAAMTDRVNDANRHSEGARVRAVEASEAAERVGEALAREVKAREALSADLELTCRALAMQNDRLARVERKADRIHKLERDLRDTHDLAERAATAHLERKPEGDVWHAFTAEPPRDGKYMDLAGCVWKYIWDKPGLGWHGVRSSRLDWAHDTEGWEWSELTSGRNNDPGGMRPTPDFPWKVWTNG